MPTGNSKIPYRGDGNPNQPEWRLPTTETQKSKMRFYGCIVFVICIPFVFFIFTAQNAFVGFASIAFILFVLIVYFAIRDAQGIATIVEDDSPVNKKDPALLDDYIAQIEWKQNHGRRHPMEPKWRFQPKLGKHDPTDSLSFSTLFIASIPPIIWIAIFGIKSPVSSIGTLIYGLIGILIFLINQNSRQ